MTLVCPCCLGDLREIDSALICRRCDGLYPVRDGVPIMLVKDANWEKKKDEIRGEVEYNTKTISQETHAKRNAFLNSNSYYLLLQSGTDLRKKSVLLVGASMAEAKCFASLVGEMTAVDIVPDLAIVYHDATRREGIDVFWVCGDGECLPFPSESFDVVIVRQALHHMLRYYSAISEFFRVARIGGRIVIIEEPYTAPDLDHPAIVALPNAFELYEGITLGELRSALGWARSDLQIPDTLEPSRPYIPAVVGDAESLLADKYHRFSAVEMIVALRMHTDQFQLFWPQEIGFADHSGPEIIFRAVPNVTAAQPSLQRLSAPTTFSAVADKGSATEKLRSRDDLVPAQQAADSPPGRASADSAHTVAAGDRG